MSKCLQRVLWRHCIVYNVFYTKLFNNYIDHLFDYKTKVILKRNVKMGEWAKIMKK